MPLNQIINLIMRVSIKGLPKAVVLKALYDKSITMGIGHLQYTPEDMTYTEAIRRTDETLDFDYVHGRVIKTNLSDDEISVWLYNRDNGIDAAEKIIAKLYEEKSLWEEAFIKAQKPWYKMLWCALTKRGS